jgi:hypothetical protein
VVDEQKRGFHFFFAEFVTKIGGGVHHLT